MFNRDYFDSSVIFFIMIDFENYLGKSDRYFIAPSISISMAVSGSVIQKDFFNLKLENGNRQSGCSS